MSAAGGATERARFKISPLCMAITVEAFEKWLTRASIGAQIRYAQAGAGPERAVVQRVKQMVRDGEVITHQPRGADGQIEYFVGAHASPAERQGAARGGRSVADPERGETPPGRILAIVRRCIKLRLPMRTNAEIAQRVEPEGRRGGAVRLQPDGRAGHQISVAEHGPAGAPGGDVADRRVDGGGGAVMGIADHRPLAAGPVAGRYDPGGWRGFRRDGAGEGQARPSVRRPGGPGACQGADAALLRRATETERKATAAREAAIEAQEKPMPAG